MSGNHRVFVTGMGIISPLGLDVATTWDGIINGRSGVDFITAFDSEGFDTHFAAEVKGFDPEEYLNRKEARRMDRFAQFAAVAAQQACRQAGLERGAVDPYRVGVIIGSGIGGIGTLTQQHEILLDRGPKRVSPFLIPMMLGDMASAQVSMVTGSMGGNYCAVSSCSSGADALGQAWAMIQRGQEDIVLAGGSEAPVVPVAVAGFNALRALSRFNEDPSKASRPFDINRDGFVMGEGAAVLVLESEESAKRRGATPLAEIKGYAATSDAHHLTEPMASGESAARAMSNALEAAGVSKACAKRYMEIGQAAAKLDMVKDRVGVTIADVFAENDIKTEAALKNVCFPTVEKSLVEKLVEAAQAGTETDDEAIQALLDAVAAINPAAQDVADTLVAAINRKVAA